MEQEQIFSLLRAYRPWNAEDARCRERFLRFVEQEPGCLCRSLAPLGHVTASAWIVDAGGERVLLTHHRKLEKWIQPGGHADGDPDLPGVALREAWEETGLRDLALLERVPFDLDIHEIPGYLGEAGHLHYDVRFLLRARGSELFRVSRESLDLAWVGLDEISRYTRERSVLRMAEKWRLIGA